MIRETQCGGEYREGRRKVRRPFSSKGALHVVCRSDIAQKEFSLLLPKNRMIVDEVSTSLAKKWGITLYDKAICANHLHLLVRAVSKTTLNAFLRALPGLIAMRITKAKKGSPLTKKFWSKRVWSRIVRFGREFKEVKAYILQNTLEALGIIPYNPRKPKKRRAPS
jgi:REP element-mobilizing transposase RayT